MRWKRSRTFSLALAIAALALGACSNYQNAPAALETLAAPDTGNYVIGAGDDISVYVWRNTELSVDVMVRPDGKISIPLVDDMPAAGRTPTDLARNIESSLAQYIQSPIVSVVVSRFVGLPNQQIRVIGEAAKPRTMIYRAEMTVLDVLIEAGGLTTFAAGNRAVVVRTLNGARQNFSVRLDDLVRDGDISANVPVAPGDIIIIPQSWF